MIIDFHTHTFPKELAAKAIHRLTDMESDSTAFTDGTNEGLTESMKRAGIDVSVLLPIATKETQTSRINELAVSTNKRFLKTGILSFGSVHPDNADCKSILKNLAKRGVRGIKLHPIFQHCAVDDIRFLRIIAAAEELGMITSIHAGYDLSMPENDISTADHILPMLKELKPQRVILAHMGSWSDWNGALRIAESTPCPVYMDTSFVLPAHFMQYGGKQDIDKKPVPQMPGTGLSAMDYEQFIQICDIVGYDHILFGSDSPWTDQYTSVQEIKGLRLPAENIAGILGGNAAHLLRL